MPAMRRPACRTRPLTGAALALATAVLAACTDRSLPTVPRPSVAGLRSGGASGTASLLVSDLDPNLCLAVSGGAAANGVEIVTAACDPNVPAQRFALQPSGVITAFDGAICFDARGGPNGYGSDGDVVQLWGCNAWDNQRWTYTAARELVVAANSKCLDIAGAQPYPGGRVIIYGCHGGANQRWVFRPLTPPIADVGGSAELPRYYVNTDLPAVTGRTITVNAGSDLQAALDTAQPGDQVILAAGATFVGNFELKPKGGMSGTQWIVVRSSGTLPTPGTRVSPADAAQMPKVLTPDANPAIRTAPAAQGWRLIGLEVSSTTSYQVNHLVQFGGFGADQNTETQVPSRLVLDRSYVHGQPDQSVRRCVGLHSSWTAVIDSYITECHSADYESQGIAGWNGPGPFKIVNNRIEGAHENIAFGGSDPSVPQLIPSDIEIRRNHVIKPPEWRAPWNLKNLVEVKSGQRILMEANVFENNWADAQSGFAFVWWSANADCCSPWSVTQDITFRYNSVRNVENGFNLADRYSDNEYGRRLPKARRITIAHNVISGPSETGRIYQIGGDMHGLTIVSNSAVGRWNDVILWGQTEPLSDFVFRNNITGGEYTFFHGTYGQGNNTINGLQIPPANVAGNVFAGGWEGATPSGNRYAASVAAIAFEDYAAGNLRLSSSSPFLMSGIGGSRPGADMDAVDLLTQGVVR